MKSILFVLLLSSFVSVHAQNADYKSIKTNYLNFPTADLSTVNSYTVRIFPEPNSLAIEDIRLKRTLKDKLQASQDRINGIVGYDYVTFKSLNEVGDNGDIAIEIAFGKFEILNKSMKEYKIPCTIKGAEKKLENIMECPAYYYLVTYSLPSILKISDKAGKIIHIESKTENDSISFGYSELSGHLKVETLDQAYNQAGTPASLARIAMKSRVEQCINPVEKIISFYNEEEKLEIATGGGKGFEYTELNATQARVVEALGNYKKTGVDPTKALNDAMAVWSKELATANLENKQARINRKIAVGLLRNKVIGYLYVYDFKNAASTMGELNTAFEGMFNQTDKVDLVKLEEKIARRNKTEANFTSNKLLMKGTPLKSQPAIEKMMTEAKTATFNPVKAGVKYPEFKSEYEKIYGAPETADTKAAKSTDTFAASIMTMATSGASAENKNYKSRVVANAGKGVYALKLFPFAGDTFTSLPLEVCALTELTELNATGIDAFVSIPDELGNLANLKKLNLYSNSNLKAIPASIGKLSRLELLDLSGCSALSDLPNEVTSLKNLKKIAVNGTGINASRIDALRAAMPWCKIK